MTKKQIVFNVEEFFEMLFNTRKLTTKYSKGPEKRYRCWFLNLFFTQNNKEKTNGNSGEMKKSLRCKGDDLISNYKDLVEKYEQDESAFLPQKASKYMQESIIDEFAFTVNSHTEELVEIFNDGIKDIKIASFLVEVYKLECNKNVSRELQNLFTVAVVISYIEWQQREGNDILCSVKTLPKSPREICYSYFVTRYKNSGRYGGYTDVKNKTGLFDTDKFALELSLNVDTNVNLNGDITKKYTLIEIINNLKNSVGISLTGAGGAGKTFVLMKTIEELFKGEDVLPIYIPLNSFSHVQVKSDSPENIFINLLKEKGFGEDPERFFEAFSQKIILFLDGFNEINNVKLRLLIIDKLRNLLTRYPGMRFVLSSRINHADEFKRLGVGFDKCCEWCHICPLEKDVIEEEARKRGVDIEFSLLPRRQQEYLRTPMGLTMFLEVSIKTGEKDIPSLGRLLYEHLKLVYSALDYRPTRFEENLSVIAYEMTKNETFQLNRTKFLHDHRECDIPTVGILSHDNDDIEGIDEKLEFRHQNYRDYYCAAFLRNKMSGGEAFIKNLDYFNKGNSPVLNDEILQLISDITEIDIIQSALTKISEMMYKDQALYSVAIYNLIKIASMKSDYKCIAELDLSGLNLESVNLNSLKLYNPEKPEQTTKLKNTLYTKRTFLQPGHSLACRAACRIGNICITMSNLNVYSYNADNSQWKPTPFKMKLLGDAREFDPSVHKGNLPSIRTCAYVGNNNIAIGMNDGSIFLMTVDFTDSEDGLPTSCFSRQVYSLKEENGKMTATFIDGEGAVSATVYSVGSEDNSFISSSEHQVNNLKTEKVIALGDGEMLVSFSNGEIHKLKVVGDSVQLVDRNKIEHAENVSVSLCASDDAVYISGGLDLYVCYKKELKSLARLTTLQDDSLKNFKIQDICYVSGGVLANLSDIVAKHDYGENINGETSSSVFYLISAAKRTVGRVMAVSKRKEHRDKFFGYTQFTVDETLYKDTAFCGVDGNDGVPSSDLYEIKISRNRSRVAIVVTGANTSGMQKLTTYSALPLSDKLIGTCSRDRSFQVMRIGHETMPIFLSGSHDGVCDIKIYENDDELYLIAASYDGCISRWYYSVWEDMWRCCNVYNIHSDWVWRIADDGKYVYSASYDGTVRKTDLETEKSEILLNVGEETQIISVALCGDIVYAVSWDKLYWYDGSAEEENRMTGEYDLSSYGKGRLAYSYDNNLYIVVNDKKNKKDTATVYLLSNGEFKPIISASCYIKAMKIINANGNAICALGGYGCLGVITGFDKLVFSPNRFSTDEPEIITSVHESARYIPLDIGGKAVNYLDIRCDSCDNEETVLHIAVCCKEKNVFSRAISIKTNGGFKVDSLFEDGTGDTHVAQPLCLMFDPCEEGETESASSRDFYVGLLDGKIYRYPDNEQVINVVPGLLANDKVDVQLDYDGMKNYFKR